MADPTELLGSTVDKCVKLAVPALFARHLKTPLHVECTDPLKRTSSLSLSLSRILNCPSNPQICDTKRNHDSWMLRARILKFSCLKSLTLRLLSRARARVYQTIIFNS